MKKGAFIIIANALIWGFASVACSFALKESGAFKEIQMILWGGALASLLVNGALVALKPKEQSGAKE